MKRGIKPGESVIQRSIYVTDSLDERLWTQARLQKKTKSDLMRAYIERGLFEDEAVTENIRKFEPQPGVISKPVISQPVPSAPVPSVPTASVSLPSASIPSVSLPVIKPAAQRQTSKQPDFVPDPNFVEMTSADVDDPRLFEEFPWLRTAMDDKLISNIEKEHYIETAKQKLAEKPQAAREPDELPNECENCGDPCINDFCVDCGPPVETVDDTQPPVDAQTVETTEVESVKRAEREAKQSEEYANRNIQPKYIATPADPTPAERAVDDKYENAQGKLSFIIPSYATEFVKENWTLDEETSEALATFAYKNSGKYDNKFALISAFNEELDRIEDEKAEAEKAAKKAERAAKKSEKESLDSAGGVKSWD